MLRVYVGALFLVLLLVLGAGYFVRAAITLTYITDLISASAPSALSTHTITFKLRSAIPPSGTVIVIPQSGHFDIPAGFDYTDVDFAVSTDNGATYTERDLASVADAVSDGVTVTSGTSGTIVITLNSTVGAGAGDFLRILLGSNAQYGTVGTQDITNPATPGSYTMAFKTYDSGGALIDYGNTMDAIIRPVGLSGVVPILTPVRYNGFPSGILAANSQNIELSLQTDITSTCRYATSSGVLYTDMTGHFEPPSAFLFYAVEHGFQNNTSYNFYVRCRSFTGGTNDDDFLISFSLKDTPPSNTSVDVPGNISPDSFGDLGRGGSGDFPNGSANLYLSSVTLSGWTVPGGAVTLFQDGVKAGSTQAAADGSFRYKIANIERGSYDFGALVVDSQGVSSSMYNASLFVGQGTQNDITSIVIAPTLSLSDDSIQAGDPLVASGWTLPNAKVEVTLELQGKSVSGPQTYRATSTTNGSWSMPIDTKSYAKGIYAVESIVIRSNGSKSGLSKLVALGIGSNPNPSKGRCGVRSDLNCDGKVNLVDFSILLTFWDTDDENADINEDGKVGLSDFSIMLFNWTG